MVIQKPPAAQPLNAALHAKNLEIGCQVTLDSFLIQMTGIVAGFGEALEVSLRHVNNSRKLGR